MRVVATAGHVDHGKSTLVLALSGTDPDRWAEEKRRGLTIDLGFAHVALPSGREVALVDVPGHVRFIRNMLAGVGAVDGALFVVAATEGWKPQSEEHLRILELLGVRVAVVAITHAASAGAQRTSEVRADVARRLADSTVAAARLVDVDVPAGVGVPELTEALDHLAAVAPPAPDRGRARLWVDRSFAAKGAGTVVTGTLAGGTLAVDDEICVVGPGRAGGRRARARIRGLQTHHESRAAVGPGARVAVNLTGVGYRDLQRGDALVHPGEWHVTAAVDVALRVLASLDHPVSRRGAFQLYAGSGEHPVDVRLIGAGVIEPGAAGHARLRLPVGLPLIPGDRFVLRESGRSETVGGGEILDVDPVLAASRARPSRSVDRVVAERGWVTADDLSRLTGEARAPDVAGRWVVEPALLAAAKQDLEDAVAGAGPLGLDVAGLDRHQRALLGELPGVVVGDGRALPRDRGEPDAGFGEEPWLAELRRFPWRAADPVTAGVGREALRQLVRTGLVVERDGVWFAAETVARANRVVADLLARCPEGVTVAEVRDALGASRKHTLPLLGHLDATGVTRRRGDRRVAGPRLPDRAPPA